MKTKNTENEDVIVLQSEDKKIRKKKLKVTFPR